MIESDTMPILLDSTSICWPPCDAQPRPGRAPLSRVRDPDSSSRSPSELLVSRPSIPRPSTDREHSVGTIREYSIKTKILTLLPLASLLTPIIMASHHVNPFGSDRSLLSPINLKFSLALNTRVWMLRGAALGRGPASCGGPPPSLCLVGDPLASILGEYFGRRCSIFCKSITFGRKLYAIAPLKSIYAYKC